MLDLAKYLRRQIRILREITSPGTGWEALESGIQVQFIFKSDFFETRNLTGLFAISGFSGGASRRVLGSFKYVFRTVFGQFSDRVLRTNRLKPLKH